MTKRFTRLTRSAIRALACGEKITEHCITAQRNAKNDVCYSVNVMVDGERIHRVIGLASSGVSRSHAERFIEAKKTEAREGRLQLPFGRKTHLTFEERSNEYIATEEAGAGLNITAKRRHMKLYLKPYFKAMRLDKISKFTIDKYKRQRIKDGAKPGTINRELTTLSHFFTIATESSWTKQRPKIEKLKEGDGRTIALTDAECEALMNGAIADQDPDCWVFVAFGLNTGMRHREILRARFDEIDWRRRRLLIPKAKTGARWQPMTVELVEILKKEQGMREDQDGWIFPAKTAAARKPYRDRISRGFARAVKRAGLSPADITPHIMRHTAATRLIESGADIITAAQVTGHKTLKMLQRYTHLSDPHIDAAIGALGRSGKQNHKPQKARLKIIK